MCSASTTFSSTSSARGVWSIVTIFGANCRGSPRPGIDVEIETRQRLQLLRDLNEQAKALGLDPGLGGEMPPQAPQ